MTLKPLKLFYPYILGLIPILIFVLIAREVIENDTYKLDLSINLWISGLQTPIWTEIMKIVSDIGMIGGVFILGLISVYLFFRKKIDILIGLLISSCGAALFIYFIKLSIARDRPELTSRLVAETGFSFPSGHATTAFIAFPILAIIIYLNPKISKLSKFLSIILLSIFPFIVAFSRLYLGVHYFTDVLAGAIVGLAVSYLFYYFKSKYNNV